MKIKTASVYGLFGLYDHTIELFPDGLTFIHSPNGYGKSTLLRILYDQFSGDTEELMNTPFQRLDIHFDDDTALITEKEEMNIHAMMQKNDIITDMSVKDVQALMDVVYLSPERVFIKKDDGSIVPAIESYASELSDLLNRDTHLNTPAHYSNNVVDDDKLISRAKDLKAKLDFMYDAGFEMQIPPGLRFPPTRYDLTESHEDYIKLIQDADEYVRENYSISESITVFKDIINNFLIDKTVGITKEQGLTVTMDDGTPLPLKRLSSGEKQIMIIFFRLLFHSHPGSLVIIDEPEISLHVTWQQRMGSTLIDVAKLRGLQIVVSTHSPQIVHDKWDLANELRVNRA